MDLRAFLPVRCTARGGFTLAEIIVSIAIGSVLVLTGVTTLRYVAQTNHRIRRLELENRLIRVGILEAINDADYWSQYDDPNAATNQGLRPIDNAAPNMFWTKTAQTGRLFTPLKSIKALDGGALVTGQPSTTAVWSITPLPAGLPDPTGVAGEVTDDLGVLTTRDADIGFDRTRPYDASDPRRWYRGEYLAQQADDKRFGRYAALSCEVKTPTLGYISPNAPADAWCRDAREPGKLDRFSGPYWAPTTGPYGKVDATCFTDGNDHVWTWLPRQLAWLHDAVGSYGLCEYLPSNTCVAAYGTGCWFVNTTQYWLHEQLDHRLVSSTFNPSYPDVHDKGDDQFEAMLRGAFAPDSGYFLNYVSTPAGSPMNAAWQVIFPASPISPYTGSLATGMATNVTPLDQQTPITIANMLRHRILAHDPQGYELENALYCSTLAKPIMPQRPPDWPAPLVMAQRYALGGRIIAQYRVRWQDASTAQIAELGFNCIGTTLRGARQQRRQASGWAAFYGANTIGAQTFRLATHTNDLTLDDP